MKILLSGLIDWWNSVSKKIKSFDKELKQFITSTLRRASLRWKFRSEAMRAGRTSRGLYRCTMCQGDFKQRDIILDHIKPVVPVTGFDNWDGFISRLFVPAEGFQILCRQCSDIKTQIEDRMRANLNAVKKEEQKKIVKAAKKANKDGN